MNLSLQDPFAVAKEFPETLTASLQYGHSVTFSFSRKGDYLASGLSDGLVVIFDLATSSVVVHLQTNAHVRPITSVNWSTCGRYLITTAQDWYVKLWDLGKVNRDEVEDAVVCSVLLDGPVWHASVHPLDPFRAVAAVYDLDPVAIDFRTSDTTTLPSAHTTLVAIYTTSGRHILTGTNKGTMNIIDANTLELLHTIKVTNSNIKAMVMAPNGCKLAINSSDRIIRQYEVPPAVASPEAYASGTATPTATTDLEFSLQQKYQDVVNRLQWNSVCFNHNGEYLVASTFGTQSSQDLYIWETTLGSLVKILEGSSEELLEVRWNDRRCMIGSNGLEYGSLYLWSIEFPQKWSALAPDFVEIEENIEYQEKEDEFDIVDEAVLNRRRLEEEDELVDIVLQDVDARGFGGVEGYVIATQYY